MEIPRESSRPKRILSPLRCAVRAASHHSTGKPPSRFNLDPGAFHELRPLLHLAAYHGREYGWVGVAGLRVDTLPALSYGRLGEILNQD